MIEIAWESVIYLIVTILLVDGIKVFLEALKPYKKREYYFDPSKVSALICAYNEEGVIGETLADLKCVLPEKQIIVVDDGSNDKTSEEVKESGKAIKAIRIDNRGKVGALKEGLKEVKTPLVLILDADTHIGKDVSLPSSLLSENTASAFNIVPRKPLGKMPLLANILFRLQTHEYRKSMEIGKRAEDATASVHCISGAAGLYQTDRLQKLTKRHSGIFTGEDLERTLIELVADGKVIFTDQEIETDVPLTLKELSKQRLVGWWPGLYRNMPLFLRILFKRKTSPILRVEMFYEIFSLATDPIKIFTLIVLFLNGNWQILFALFSFYFILESFLFYRTKNKLFVKEFLIIPIYVLFYSPVQMFLRVGAAIVFFKLILSHKNDNSCTQRAE